MNIAELKLKFFRRIYSLDKEELEEAYGILLNYINSKDDPEEWNNLTFEQQKDIIDGIELIEKNEGIPHNKVTDKLKERYSE